MTATGIGAAVRRKEDFRFIIGKGQYTDDISRPGETRAAFVRSPHAHAKIKNIDGAEAKKMPGVVAVLTGKHEHGTVVSWPHRHYRAGHTTHRNRVPRPVVSRDPPRGLLNCLATRLGRRPVAQAIHDLLRSCCSARRTRR